MANHNPHGGRPAAPPEQDPSNWRPQDPGLPGERRRDLKDERDERAWRDQGGDEERDARRWQSEEEADLPSHGPGPVDRHGHRAGRYGEERLRELQATPRRDGWSPSAGSFEERRREIDADAGYWADRSGPDPACYDGRASYRGRDFEPERRGLSRGSAQHVGDPATLHGRGDERLGYAAGSYRRGGAWTGDDAPASPGPYVDRGTAPHVHRGTGPHRGKGPAGYQRSDDWIREQVCESLTEDDQVDASGIEVGVSRGEVTLSGTVDDRRAKRDAEDCAYSVPGVRDVQNLLRVGDDPAATRSNPSGAVPVRMQETESSARDRKHRA